MTPHLNEEHRLKHRHRNMVHSIILVGGLGLLMSFCAWLIWGWFGVLWALILVGLIGFYAPRMPPDAVMAMYRARPVDKKHGGQLFHIVEVLANRAELPAHPKLYVVPSMTLNAFATGSPEKSSIAVTEGLLRKLPMRNIAGVLAHEISHIRNNDLWVMGLADVMSRLTQIMSLTAIFVLLFNLPAIFTGRAHVPWLAIILLYLAPTIGSLLQLALSRTREYDADLEGALLTGDPVGLASALKLLERHQGRFWEDLIFPGRRIPQPSLLRSHPSTDERVARLRELVDKPGLPPIVIQDEPLVTMVGFGPINLRPRYRWPGVWF